MANRTVWALAASLGGLLLAATPALAFPYKVEAGEDLRELSARFQIPSNVLAQVNRLRAQPTAGQILQIPYQQYSTAPKAPPMNATAEELEVLARIIKGECPPDVPYIGRVAVAAVVLNRVRSRSFPNTITGVAHQRYQFSSYNPNYRQRLYYGPVPDWCFAAARAALGGMDPTNNCTYYFNPFLVKPSWARGMTFVLRIGETRTNAHDFYRPPSQPTHGNGTNLAAVGGRGDAAVPSARPRPSAAPNRPSAARRGGSSSGRARSGGSSASSAPRSSPPSFSAPTGFQNGSFSGASPSGSSGQRGRSAARPVDSWDPSNVTGLSSVLTGRSAAGRSTGSGADLTTGPSRLGMSDLLSRLDGSNPVGEDGQPLLPGSGWVDDPEAKICRIDGAPMGVGAGGAGGAAEAPDNERNVVRRLLAKVRSLLGIGNGGD